MSLRGVFDEAIQAEIATRPLGARNDRPASGVRSEEQERDIKNLRQRLRELEEWQDTICSPLPKRVWWWCQGYRWRKAGRWYGKTKDLR